MKIKFTVLALVVICGLCLSGPVMGQGNPYGDNTPVKATKKTDTKKVTTAPAADGISVDDLRKYWDGAKTTNNFSNSNYKSFIVGFPIVTGKITFFDETKNYERVSWFESILSEHGVQVLNMNKQEIKTKTGWLSSSKKMSVTASVKGRDFVLSAIIGYYGGTLGTPVAAPSAPGDAMLKDIVAMELRNRDLELDVLRNSFEVDKQIIARSKLGMFDISAKNKIDALVKDLKENKIPAGKQTIAQNQAKIASQFVDLGDKDLALQKYLRALANYDISMTKTDYVSWQRGNAYMGLKDYDAAIKAYSAMSSSGAEQANNGIADAQHGKGNDREALNSLYNVIGSFHNSPEELKALEKIDKWGYLNKTADYPEITGKLSNTYLTKSLINSGSNSTLATKDYQRAVEIRADGGNKATASKAILSEYSATVSSNKQALSDAKQAANNRFNSERQSAQTNLRNAENNYDSAISRARSDYNYDLRRKSDELETARRELNYLLSRPPSTGGSSTDPYSSKPSGSTDPYASKPSGSTDPYSSSKKTSGSTDPYGSSSTKKSGTDPYGGSSGSPSGSTDPYGGSSGSTGGSTDPYNGNYDSQVSAARERVDRLDREYRYLYGNQTSYVDERTQTEAASLQDARARYARYDLSKQETFVSNDSQVIASSRALAQSDANYKTMSQLAKSAGY